MQTPPTAVLFGIGVIAVPGALFALLLILSARRERASKARVDALGAHLAEAGFAPAIVALPMSDARIAPFALGGRHAAPGVWVRGGAGPRQQVLHYTARFGPRDGSVTEHYTVVMAEAATQGQHLLEVAPASGPAATIPTYLEHELDTSARLPAGVRAWVADPGELPSRALLTAAASAAAEGLLVTVAPDMVIGVTREHVCDPARVTQLLGAVKKVAAFPT